MTTIFKAGQSNFPANQDELDGRLRKIERLINNKDNVSQVNIEFIKATFQLMQDCNLITRDCGQNMENEDFRAEKLFFLPISP